MYRVLVATHGSEHSLRPLACAARRAKSEPSKIYLLRVEKAATPWDVGPVSSDEPAEECPEPKRGEVRVRVLAAGVVHLAG